MLRTIFKPLLLTVLFVVWLTVNLAPHPAVAQFEPTHALTEDWIGTMEKALTLFKEDLDRLQASSSITDRSATLQSLKNDLELLLELQKWRPPDDPSPPLDVLKEWNPASIKFRDYSGYIDTFRQTRNDLIRLRRQILR